MSCLLLHHVQRVVWTAHRVLTNHGGVSDSVVAVITLTARLLSKARLCCVVSLMWGCELSGMWSSVVGGRVCESVRCGGRAGSVLQGSRGRYAGCVLSLGQQRGQERHMLPREQRGRVWRVQRHRGGCRRTGHMLLEFAAAIGSVLPSGFGQLWRMWWRQHVQVGVGNLGLQRT